MRKIVSFLLMLLLSTSMAIAQTRTITGKVTETTGEAIGFATIAVKGAKTTVAADPDGSFRIQAKDGDVLVVTAVNFETKEVTVGSESNLTVSLTRVSNSLTDVVVTTALGVQRQAKSLGYATAKVGTKELTQARVVNLQNGLTGKVSGLNIQTANNGVFADTRITLRGIRSLTGNNQPMLILDGVPLALSYISSINPNDVADVTVLKSSSSTAIYGPDGVNGAIVITTKKGVKGKPQISVSNTTQFETVSYLPKLQTRFGGGSSIDANGYGVYDPIENQGYGDAFDGSLRQIGRDAPDGSKYEVTYVARPEEKKKFWNTGITNQTDISFATGDFYLSAQNVDIQGVVPKDENHRRNVRMRAEKEYNRFKAAFNLSYTQGKYDITTQPGRDESVYWNLINTPMQIPITAFKDWRNDYWSSPDGYYNDYYSNPYFIIDNYRTTGRSDDLFGNVELNFKVASWMNLTYRIGASINNSTAKNTTAPFTYSQFTKESGKSIAQSGDIVAAVGDATSFSSRITSEIFATFNKKFGGVNLDLLVGQSFRDISSKTTNISSSNLGQSTLYNVIVRKGEPSVAEADSRQKLERFFGKFAVGYNDWLFAEFTGSYDIDSRLSNPYQPVDYSKIAFFYPGASLSVLVNELIPGLKNNNFLSYFKVRGAISKTGNVNLGAYSLENTYGLSTFFPYGDIQGFGSTGTLVQSQYKPEFVNNKEVGIELGFLKNRINIEANAYTQNNTDQIISVAYSSSTGFPRSVLNAASFDNKGLEIDLKLTPLIKLRDVTIDFKVNYTLQDSKVTSLIDGVDELAVGNANYAIVGMPAFVFKLTDYLRDDQGRVIVDGTTGMPQKNPNTSVFGRTLPKNIIGLNLGVNWKGFSLNAVADYRGGNQIYSGNIGSALDFSGISYRSGQNDRQAFVFPNSVYYDGSKYVENTSIYTKSYGYNFWSQDINTGVQSNYISSGAFWKLREVSIAYSLPSKALSGFLHNAVKGLTIAVNGRNLKTWLPKSNQWTDPEFSASTSSNGQGVSSIYNTVPTRIFGASVTVQF
ncbi:SusC/RagA family TonB-linked outer membrane protein [Panacibacter sp. DH6]|uniref:SusC/RagA family TonB-linked outer membrane protein n=1 Tax=Panacibacter microcysteis TaxID=2793269 RepID=A0A931DZX2_9BACT|nr:SusC/RagA family TonB-linked outer membrane protein [Panacibacter microcysteis]MBG9374880.1 SusC/RagA family TonB-linked outer membrane protein [Panacibacter microcysteis]